MPRSWQRLTKCRIHFHIHVYHHWHKRTKESLSNVFQSLMTNFQNRPSQFAETNLERKVCFRQKLKTPEQRDCWKASVNWGDKDAQATDCVIIQKLLQIKLERNLAFCCSRYKRHLLMSVLVYCYSVMFFAHVKPSFSSLSRGPTLFRSTMTHEWRENPVPAHSGASENTCRWQSMRVGYFMHYVIWTLTAVSSKLSIFCLLYCCTLLE